MRASINICGYLCVSVYAAARPDVCCHMFASVSCKCVRVSVCVHGGEAKFYSHIYIHMPSLYSTLLPKNGPQLSLFPVHPQRSCSWQKTHQVGRTTDN